VTQFLRSSPDFHSLVPTVGDQGRFHGRAITSRSTSFLEVVMHAVGTPGPGTDHDRTRHKNHAFGPGRC